MATDRTPAVLVKGPPLDTVSLRLGLSAVRLKAEPLFEHIPPERNARLGATSSTANWRRLALEEGDDRNLWDLCHALAGEGRGMGAAGQSAAFAEPDLWQQWNHPMPRVDFGLASTCALAPAPQRTNFPNIPGKDLWFRDGDHSGFDALGGLAAGTGARIAHIDTGYDPHHDTLPRHLRRDLQRNFVERANPNDATDVTEGLWVQDGHGTGTIGILASDLYGGAPGAEVVPIRIADRVVLFRNSAFAKALDYIYGLKDDPAKRIDVVTMSMGGVASQAWAEAVNRLYEAGIFIVTAAGNNQGNLPTRNIVFPARFGRVVAACGVMADGSPYTDLGLDRMAGNYGPDSKMRTALAAPTPNLPWAVGGCRSLVNHSGQGTSCATPQIAAAAAVWIARNRAALDRYPQAWMKVEAVRRALFDSAHPGHAKLGRGALQADQAMALAPVVAARLNKEASASAEFPLLRLFTGLGAAAPPVGQLAMLELEALQLSQSSQVEALLPDPQVSADQIPPEVRRRIAEALADQPGASQALKQVLGAGGGKPVNPAPVARTAAGREMAAVHLDHAVDPPVRPPANRRLRVFTYDPSLSASQDTAAINIAKLEIPWEPDLQPGPVGEYLEVIDVDPVSGAAYAPVDLNHPHLLSRDGLSPTPADPRFHQQMTYAVSMKTIGHFERALGRSALWSSRRRPGGRAESFVRRLRIYPHAFRGANAYYSAERKALLFGYFPANAGGDWRNVVSGQKVFACLSHDIIAHETTHALLDGLHPYYREASNPEVLAFHEAFADLVALFQHFTLPEAVEHQIARTRGDLTQPNPLIQLAIEFGRATSHGGHFQKALREAVDDLTPQKLEALEGAAPPLPDEAHDRGAHLVAAVFDAFITLYQARQDEMLLLATGGSGVLPEGFLPQPLVKALAKEAGKVADHIMTICIRALDYCPPVDLDFGDYLRAMITADRDVVPDDRRGYRLALIAGFAKRGIFPQNVPHLSPDALVWEAPPMPIASVAPLLPIMDLGWNRSADRERAWELSRENARTLHGWLTGWTWKDGKKVQVEGAASPAEIEAMGLYREPGPQTVTWRDDNEETHTEAVTVNRIEVHSVRPARRAGPDGFTRSDLVVEITQGWTDNMGEQHRGGCTVLFDLETSEARYLVRKRVANLERVRRRQAEDAAQRLDLDAATGMRDVYFKAARDREPFAALHQCY